VGVRFIALFSSFLALGSALSAQARNEPASASLGGRVLEATSGVAVPGATVTIEGLGLGAIADSLGRYRFGRVPPGPQVLSARRVGYAPTRVSVTIPARGSTSKDIILARASLRLDRVIVTADPTGRARGELGTASVVGREAIANQSATSLQGVLELIPGVPLSPPGLDGTAQIGLRSVPASSAGPVERGPSAANLAAFGTLIILDGVPLSNNANLQSLGPRGELPLASSAAGGGIDLRRIPAATLERVEVMRGVPSSRYGDLTQGAVLVDTRAGVVAPVISARYDARTLEASLVGGREFGGRNTLTLSSDIAHTRIAPGLRDDDAYRLATQLAHRLLVGQDSTGKAGRIVFDTRLDFYQLLQSNPEQPEVIRGRASLSRDNGLRLSERARLALGGSTVELTAAVSRTNQRSSLQTLRIRGATPFTDRLDEGRSIGRFIGGEYLSRVEIDGTPWLVYGRLEWDGARRWLGFDHRLRAGTELRREWNDGPGYQFDIEFPPQVSGNGVQGFDRPYRYDDVPAVATSAFYLDDRLLRTLPGDVSLDVQAGLRAEVFHSGSSWFSGARDVVLQPRLNVQLAPRSWLRVRAGAGTTAKLPSLGSLYPAPQFYDVVNVNRFTNDPAERLAVLTTFVRDPRNNDLGFSTGRKAEVGLEMDLGARGASIGVVAFNDATRGGAGLGYEPGFILRDRFDLSDSSSGTGRPPTIIEPSTRADTIPILLDRPGNNLTLQNSGYELSASFPEIRVIHTRLEVQGAWIRTRLSNSSQDFDVGRRFTTFQLDERIQRVAYYPGITRTGERALLTYRVIHQQPELGLVVTTIVQHNVHDLQRDVGSTDSLAFAGFVTRTGVLVPLSREDRGRPEYADLRGSRTGQRNESGRARPDWFLSIQVAKTLPREGRLSFYGFNIFDRIGQLSTGRRASRQYPPIRFGVEVTMPVVAFLP